MSPHSHREPINSSSFRACTYFLVLKNALSRASRSFPRAEIRQNHSPVIVAQVLETSASGKATSSGKGENAYVAHDQRCRSSEVVLKHRRRLRQVLHWNRDG